MKKSILFFLFFLMAVFAGYPVNLYSKTTALQGEVWELLEMTNKPPARYCHAQVYDAEKNTLTIFGGWDFEYTTGDYIIYDDTWQADLTTNTWMKIETDTCPSPRGSYSILDTKKNRLLILGGFAMFNRTDFYTYNDVWQFDLDSLKWTKLTSTGSPPRFIQDNVIYDPVDRRIILFADDSSAPYNKIWTLNLDSLKWQRMETTGSIPPVRWAHGTVYDALKHRILLFGGKYVESEVLKFRKDLWELDLTAHEWKEITFSPPFPSARGGMAMTMDEPNNRFILFGGEGTGYNSRSDFWGFDLLTQKWKRLPQNGDLPGKRSWISFSSDNANKKMFFFGGNDSFTTMHNELYELTIPDQSTFVKRQSNKPADFQLIQNYPNPFNPETQINYDIPEQSHVKIEIYNALSQRVTTLVNSDHNAGHYKIVWKGTNGYGEKMGTGIYLCKMQGEGFVKTIKLALVK